MHPTDFIKAPPPPPLITEPWQVIRVDQGGRHWYEIRSGNVFLAEGWSPNTPVTYATEWGAKRMRDKKERERLAALNRKEMVIS